jgi:hypothetical protein
MGHDLGAGAHRRVFAPLIGYLILALPFPALAVQPLPPGICVPDALGVVLACPPSLKHAQAPEREEASQLPQSLEEHLRGAESPEERGRAQPEERGSGQEHAERNRPAPLDPAEPIEPVPAAEYNPPCPKGQDDRRSDLCAQWKAADSAADGAFWSKLQAYLSGAGIIGLLYSLYLTREATRIASEASTSAENANQIATRTAKEAVEAAIEANRLTYKAFIADQRPWIAVEPKISGPLKWNSKAFYFPVRFRLKNVGKIPALHVRVRPALILDYFHRSLVVRQCEHADEWMAKKASPGGHIFPEEESEKTIHLHRTQTDYDQAIEWLNKNVGTAVDGKFVPRHHEGVEPALIGTVIYWSPGTETWHQTGFIYMLVDKRIINGRGRIISRERGDVPEDCLALVEHWHQGRTT